MGVLSPVPPVIDEEMLGRMRIWADRKARAMLPPDEAPDAVQEALVAVWRAMHRLDGRRDPWPLLTVVARQEIAAHARAYYAGRNVPIDDMDDRPTPSVEDETLAALEPAPEFSAEVGAALLTLTPRQREIVLATSCAGRTNVAAASLLGVSEARIRQARTRAESLLRDQIMGEAA